ncbi:MAG TPA: DUF4446 family protein [Candidatus Paceibacterota bacterium]|nr:DUF4446 family protein [Candidatus Paceibacterota bacterium]
MLGILPLWAIVALSCTIIAIVVLLVLVVKLRTRLSKFMVGKDAASLEATLQWLTEKSTAVDETLAAHRDALEFIDKRVKRSVRGYSLIRYDAYENAGGEQSFSSGIVDEHGDGYILSVVANRNHTGVYAKRVTAFIPEAPLTDEEKEALTIAKKSIEA